MGQSHKRVKFRTEIPSSCWGNSK